MTKLESADYIIKNRRCIGYYSEVGIYCNECCLEKGKYSCSRESCRTTEDQVQLAIKYKKEHSVNPICNEFCTFDE